MQNGKLEIRVIINKKVLGTILLFITLLLNNICSGQKINWKEFENDLNEFILNPNHENAEKAYNLLPNKLSSGEHPNWSILDSIYRTSVKLNIMIIKENRDALRIAFKLYTIADGGFAEDLDIMIGKLITINPKLFLQELINHRQLVHLDGLLGNYGTEFVDSFKQSLIETEKRINSLKKINELSLNKVRDECLENLEIFKQTLKEAIKNGQ